MKKIRIGNDILVKLTSQTEQSLEGRKLMVVMSTIRGQFRVDDFTVQGNLLSFTYPGAEQSILGVYTITVIENNGEPAMRTTDICEAFCLVPRSCMTGGSDSEGLQTEILEFDFSMTAGAVVDYSDLINKPSINSIELSGDKSAKDLGLLDSEKVLSKDIATIIEDLDEPEEEPEVSGE